MLLSLDVKNIAVIKEISFIFENGLNVITGETGAGKSIVIDSLNFVLGDRADKTLIRHEQEVAVVQACFFIKPEFTNLIRTFNEYGIDYDNGNIVIKRNMNINGRSESRINGSLVTLTILKDIVSQLVDVHSQHETQSLLNEQKHLSILDSFSEEIICSKELFAQNFHRYQTLLKEITSFPKIVDLNYQLDLLKYQIEEISNANLKKNEEEDLIQERTALQNREKILSSLSTALSFLDGREIGGVEPSLVYSIKEINYLSRFDDKYLVFKDRLDSVLIEIKDITSTLEDMLKQSVYDNERLEIVEKRIDFIRKLKRKYGNNESQIQQYFIESEERYSKLSLAEETINTLNNQIEKLKHTLMIDASKLHQLRIKTGLDFSQKIEDQLRDLGMKNAKFCVEVSFLSDLPFNPSISLNKDGGDQIKFLISINTGEPLKNLSKVASGGEMSRIMLAIKNITADLENIDTLIFDEIDSGISGNAAKIVARKLLNISRGRQVVVVTHLSQIAAMGDANFLITKTMYDSETITEISALNEKGVLSEIMRIGGSDSSSSAGYQTAKELRTWANSYKDPK